MHQYHLHYPSFEIYSHSQLSFAAQVNNISTTGLFLFVIVYLLLDDKLSSKLADRFLLFALICKLPGSSVQLKLYFLPSLILVRKQDFNRSLGGTSGIVLILFPTFKSILF